MSCVSIERCKSYDIKNVEAAINKTFVNLGGVGKFIKPGMKVAIKPNLVMKKRPEEAATTHPSLIKAICSLVNAAGGEILIIDSPGGLYTESALKGVYNACGMTEAARVTGVNLNFSLDEAEVDIPDGKILKRVTLLKPLVEADIIINVSKLKTHGQMVYTGAVKNMFGAVPGVLKAEYHLRMAEYNDFANALIDIFLSVRPSINILDAVIGMEGDGPTAGNPKKIGYIMGSENAFELDLAALDLININPADVPVIKNAIGRGLCCRNIAELEIIGENLDNSRLNGFDVPQLDTLRAIQFYDKGLMKFLISWLRPKPAFVHALCTGCKECVRSCPAHIIEMYENRPRVDLSGCIRCFCCQELCPAKAVNIKRPFLSKFLFKKAKKCNVKKDFCR
ncbi:MAG: DUF362 domain-containing protein [Clostridia bacterium]|nr:DUF362 domain-containing protein [Clostridia bacterium]